MEPKDYTKYFFILFSLFLIFLVYYIVKPFLVALLSSFIIAYIFYPVYSWLKSKLKSENISAAICLVLIVLVLLVPLGFLLMAIANDLPETYAAWEKYTKGAVFNKLCEAQPEHYLCNLQGKVQWFLKNERLGFSGLTMQKITDTINKRLLLFIFSLPGRILDTFIILFVTFYLFKDAHVLIDKIRGVLPLKEAHRNRVMSRLHDVTNATIYGQVVVASIQGMLAGIGYFIFGVDQFVVFGTLTFFAAIIPVFGTGLIWVPVSLAKILNGYLLTDQAQIFQGILLFVYCFFFVSLADNIIKPKIIGNKADVHPAIILLGVLGGIRLFGIIGFIIGPVLLSVFLTVIKIYEEEKSYMK